MSDIFKCRKCNLVKPLNDFHILKASPTGHLSTCKSCTNAYSSRYHKANYVPKVRDKNVDLKIKPAHYDASWESVYLSEVSRYWVPY
jgi:hypothetical protein